LSDELRRLILRNGSV